MIHAGKYTTLGVLAALLVGGCVEPVDSPRLGQRRPALQPGAAPAAKIFEDRQSGVRFALPAGMQVEVEHFEPGAPGQLRHLLTLTRARQESLSLQLWDNPTALPVGAWFEEHLAFVRDGHARIRWDTVSAHAVRGMVIRQPRSPQAFGQRMALFSAAGRVVRVTCQNEDHQPTLAAFSQVLRTLKLSGGGS